MGDNQVVINTKNPLTHPYTHALSKFSRGFGKVIAETNGELHRVEITAKDLKKAFSFCSKDEAVLFYMYAINNLGKLDKSCFPVRVQRVEVNHETTKIEFTKVAKFSDVKKTISAMAEQQNDFLFKTLQQCLAEKRLDKLDALNYFIYKKEQQEKANKLSK